MDTLDVEKLKEKLEESYLRVKDEACNSFSRYFQKTFGESLLAVILYGSCLSEKTRSPTSIYDFYLLVDSYWGFYRNKLHALLNYFLPPNSYNLKTTDEDQNPLLCKYCVISLKSLKKETSPVAKDIYHFGRFAKRVGIIWVKNEQIKQELLDCLLNAIRTNILYVVPTLPDDFILKDFIIQALSLSYQGETRIEKENKIEEFYGAEKEFYTWIYGTLLDHHLDQHSLIKDPAGTYRFRQEVPQRESGRKRTEGFLKKSRRRFISRWPKHIFTYRDYIDYLLAKVERSRGIKIELTPIERRFPLIFGWKHFYRLKRKGMIK
ncbi:MAG: hypothetical protein JSU92_11485 [Deltaproteobacteria bacterium]|nr:MAG: hypothetical protein JSU92_11485 [Deltaproteobacteria bacterium]